MTGTLHENVCTFIISRSILFTKRKISDRSSRENQNTYFIIKMFFFNRAVHEIMSKNTVEPDTP